MKRLSSLLALALVGVSLGAEQKPSTVPQGKEAVYEGKTVHQWIAQTNDIDRTVRQTAAEALGKMAPEAKSGRPCAGNTAQGPG